MPSEPAALRNVAGQVRVSPWAGSYWLTLARFFQGRDEPGLKLDGFQAKTEGTRESLETKGLTGLRNHCFWTPNNKNSGQ